MWVYPTTSATGLFELSFERTETSASSKQVETVNSVLDSCFDRSERTLGGQVIGALRDLASSNVNEPASAKQLRVSSNDRIAEIAVDTVAFLPSFKWTSAGLLRAVCLSDPSRNLSGNGILFGKNFLEGAALNRVAKLGAAEGILARSLNARYGSGLATEAITHLAVGAGMGVVKTGFNQRAWQDKSGEFSWSVGVDNVVKSGGIGALTNLPAASIATRFSRAAAASAAEGRISERAATLAAGWGSGYASGSVFGGIDAFVAGKDLSGILSSINEGGLVGGFTGAFVHGYESNRLRPSSLQFRPVNGNSEGKLAKSKELLSPTRPDARGEATAEQPKGKGEGPRDVQFQKMEITVSRDVSLEKLTSRLSFHRVSEPMSCERPASKSTFTDWQDFAAHALVTREIPARVYKVDTLSTEIVIPEAYARKLDAVRSWRLQAEQKFGARITSQEACRLAQAKQALKADPYGNRMLPEDFIPLLEALPERNLVRRLVLLDDRNPQDRWFKQIYRENFESAASASESGVVTFYLKERDNPGTEWIGRGEMNHEWSHLLKGKLSNESTLFDLACQLESPERGGYFSREYAKAVLAPNQPHEENWAVHLGERFLHTDADTFANCSERMPVRSVVMARALSRSLISVPERERSPYHTQYWNRVRFVEKEVLPRAQEILAEGAVNPDARVGLSSIKLLGSFGNESHIAVLKKIASDSNNTQLAEAAYEAVTKLPRSREGRIDLLVELSRRPSRTRAQAVNDLSGVSAQYAALAKALESGSSGEMIKLIDRMPDTFGRRLAIGEALRLSKERASLTSLQSLMEKDSLPPAIRREAFDAAMSILKTKPDQRIAISLNVLSMHPELRVQALDQLKAYPVPEISRRVERYVNDSNREVAVRAQQIVAGERTNSQFMSLLARLDLGSPAEKVDAARQLGALRDLRAVRPLLRSAATGDAQLAGAVTHSLRQFAPELVKFEARELSRSAPELGSRLREMLFSACRS